LTGERTGHRGLKRHDDPGLQDGRVLLVEIRRLVDDASYAVPRVRDDRLEARAVVHPELELPDAAGPRAGPQYCCNDLNRLAAVEGFRRSRMFTMNISTCSRRIETTRRGIPFSPRKA
jgi:hypothetical protein